MLISQTEQAMLRDADIKKAQKSSRGVVRDDRGQDQPSDKRAAQNSGKTSPDAGQRSQKDAANTTPMNPGEPAGGE